MRLYIGNLPFAMTDCELEQQLGKFGPVADVHVLRTPDGQSRGMGFVTMRDAADTAAVLEAGSFEYMGRRPYVRPARREGTRATGEILR